MQLCDGLPDCERSNEALIRDAVDDRSAPGEGALHPGRVLDCLPSDIPLALEVRSRSYRERFPDPVERAVAVRQATMKFLEGRTT